MASQDVLSGISGAVGGAASGVGVASGLLQAGAAASVAGPIGWALGGILAISGIIGAGVTAHKRREAGAASNSALDSNFAEQMQRAEEVKKNATTDAAYTNEMNRLGLEQAKTKSADDRASARAGLSDLHNAAFDKSMDTFKSSLNPTQAYKSRLTQAGRWS